MRYYARPCLPENAISVKINPGLPLSGFDFYLHIIEIQSCWPVLENDIDYKTVMVFIWFVPKDLGMESWSSNQ